MFEPRPDQAARSTGRNCTPQFDILGCRGTRPDPARGWWRPCPGDGSDPPDRFWTSGAGPDRMRSGSPNTAFGSPDSISRRSRSKWPGDAPRRPARRRSSLRAASSPRRAVAPRSAARWTAGVFIACRSPIERGTPRRPRASSVRGAPYSLPGSRERRPENLVPPIDRPSRRWRRFSSRSLSSNIPSLRANARRVRGRPGAVACHDTPRC
jgi:hypothetical protein